MEHAELSELVETYQDDFSAIQSILEDETLTSVEKLDAIADVVEQDGDDGERRDDDVRD